MFLVSAEAKTSAGAPWVICVTRSEEPAKLSVTLVPGFLASKSLASWVNVDFSEAAAKTVTVPLNWDVLLVLDGAAAGAVVPQAVRAPANPTATEMPRMLFFMRRVFI